MTTPEFKNPPIPTNQAFTYFAKGALGEMVLKSVQTDLQQYFDKFHAQQMKDLDSKMAGFEKQCVRQIQASMKENVKLQFEARFKEVVQACQKDISQVTSPLFKRTEGDVQSLARHC